MSEENNQQKNAITTRIDKLFEEKKYYEAEQTYKTLYFRFRTQKKYNEAIEMLRTAMIRLNSFHQGNCAAELGSLLVEAFKYSGTPFGPSTYEIIEQVSNSFQDPVEPTYFTFMKGVAKWTESSANQNLGAPEIHTLIAERYWSGLQYGQAASHFVRGNNPQLFAQRLFQWSLSGYKNEYELFVARPVLQYLCLKNLKDANILFETYLSLHRQHAANQDGNEKKPEFDLETSPLVNFLRFLLACLEREAYPLFDMLKKRYAPSLQRDPGFNSYLTQIAKVFYNVNPPQGGLEGLFGNLMKSMFSG